ncbi:MAG: CinA family protein [Marinospirillum sp.]|uniref:CinA family protein n=1 Tax=Marinospirillum sp. TaxID=2183934 RepID=UPI0019FB8039|nr:CinA family protein [Marinospirillum sp.]MBE0507483.1 CinA family protein [Marinospirillum sp.]
MNRISLINEIAHLAIQQNKMLGTAESCTGGGVAKALTEVAGSSAWFTCGLVTYSNQAKHLLLGVDESTLVQQGAVSEAVVKQMVAGACVRGEADLAVAISGVAGPGGGSDDKPVGCVWLAWGNASEQWAQRYLFKGDRRDIREASIDQALQGLLQALQKSV